MANLKSIHSLVQKIKSENSYIDIYKICKALKIDILEKNLGKNDTAIKGFFVHHCRIKVIIINSDMPENLKRIILAHELGHALLHTEKGIKTFQESCIFNINNSLEKEANQFAADLLIDEDKFMELCQLEHSCEAVAAYLQVPVQLLCYKWEMMEKYNENLGEFPFQAKNSFLRDLEIPKIDDDYIY